jgi:RNA polymerase sigma factor (sigma-70 family)
LRTLSNPQDAEDVTQEALAPAWSHFETFDGYSCFETWVFRIARNLIIDLYRRRRNRREISLDAPMEGMEGREGLCLPELSDSADDPLLHLDIGTVEASVWLLRHSHQSIPVSV